ncbi:hypothetical protein M569_02691 [Genlisea aurea]|uniref:C3HC-type domain-containing protein n=1 Tax=Genlisea aurea TaxID=192259 RepID=S8EH93_9LAMI|nr:hypothetical protein M569_02691 [Genlisea aurea]
MPKIKDEAISSSGDPLLPPRSSSPPRSVTPAASSVGASSPAVPMNAGSTEWWSQGQNSKGGSLSQAGSRAMYESERITEDGSVLGSSHPSCRPWDRSDLLRRLSTFNPANWFGKPKSASSLACARKGWVNVDVDKLNCESCGASLIFVSSATWTPYEADCAGEDFSKKLDEGHKISCPWIGNCCAESLVQFPPTPPSALIGGYKDRCDGLLQFPSLPVVATCAIELMRLSRGSEIDRLLTQTQFARNESGIKLEICLGSENSAEDFLVFSRAQKLISLCGWEPRWLPNIQDCEEHSAESAGNGRSIGQPKYRVPPRHLNRGKKPVSGCAEKEYELNEGTGTNSKSSSRSPLLDCSLCGATVRIWEFVTVIRPTSFVPSSGDVPKKLGLTRGMSAASGISGWIPIDGMEKEQVEEEGKSLSNAGVDLNLTMSAGVSTSRSRRNGMSRRQPASSEVGGRAESYESHGPSSRKRNFDEAGSTVDRPQLVAQYADSVEGTVIDRDCDEVDGGCQYSTGPPKRAGVVVDTRRSPYRIESCGAGPSHTLDYDFDQGAEQAVGNLSAHVSSVIAMNCNDEDDDSMESVENFPGVDFDDVHMPSTSTAKDAGGNETSELQAQQSACLAADGGRAVWEIGLSSTNEDEVLNADTETARERRDVPSSVGISGGSVGMGASHEAEIHGADASLHRTESIAGCVEPVGGEVTDNQGQTGDFIPEDMDREDRQGDSQDLVSRSVIRADSGSKVVGSAKAESVESGEKTSHMNAAATYYENSPNPSLSCNAILCSGFDMSKEEVTQTAKDLTNDDGGYAESNYRISNGNGPPNGSNNYEEAVEFDPIKSHNHCCPWVNGNVAAAGCSSGNSSGSTASAIALCGWQLTLDALDTFQSLGQIPVQTVESESAASMYKDDDKGAPGRKKLLTRQSFNKSRRKN